MKQIKDGKWKEFNRHAVLIAEGFYVNGVKHGMWREYYDETGTVSIEENYRHGIPHGPFRSFYPSGLLFSKGQFVDGLREGYFNIYDEQGKNIKNIYFINNIDLGEQIDFPCIAEPSAERKV